MKYVEYHQNLKKLVLINFLEKYYVKNIGNNLEDLGEFKDTNSRGVFDDNEIRLKDNFAEIDTYDSYGNVMETFILDVNDISKLKGHKWRTVYKNDKPYLFTGNQKKERIYFHRLVLPTDKQVDHISGDTRDNRKSNLREVTVQENMLNLQKKSTNTSGIRGVSFCKKSN